MSTPNLTLPLDPTGSAASNLIQNEPHAIGVAGVRAFPLNYGLFFRDSVVITDVATGKPLTGSQYSITDMALNETLETGQEINAVVLITDTAVSANVTVTYQALGGVNSLSSSAAQSAIAGLTIDDTVVPWSIVTNVPAELPPAAHHQGADTVFGWEYVTRALSRLGSAITEGQGAAQAELLNYAQDVVAELENFIAQANAALLAHETNYNNPHQTTANEIGAYSTEQTVSKIADQTSARQAGDAAVEAALSAHTNNHSNPHAVTPAQLGAYTQAQSDGAMQAMKTAVMASVTANEATQTAHITNYNNPHQVTAAQVGTWTTEQIAAAVNNAATTLQQQVSAYQSALQAHEANVSNPHQDTAANVGTWTSSAINSNITVPYNAHVNNTGNPHQDSYTNIVTSGVDGSGMYSATTMSNSISSANTSMQTQINSLNSTINSHVNNRSNPHGDNVSNTGGAYTVGQLQYAISLLQAPGGSASNAINYLASVHN